LLLGDERQPVELEPDRLLFLQVAKVHHHLHDVTLGRVVAFFVVTVFDVDFAVLDGR